MAITARPKRFPKRQLSLLAAAVGIAFVLGQYSVAPRATVPASSLPVAPAGGFVARVTKVYDGDTVMTEDGRKIRLLAIDTPERGFKDSAGVYHKSPAPFADRAAERLKGLAEGQQCSFSFDRQQQDRYGRTLAFMVCRGVDVNRTMLAEGLASVMIYPPNDARKDEFLSVQRAAQSAGAGLWAGGIVPADTAGKHVNELRVVRGRVRSVSPQKAMIYLNFGADYKTDFTVGIRRRDWPLFAAVGVRDPKAYEGKEVSVTGRIRDRNGPYIDITIPEQIAVE